MKVICKVNNLYSVEDVGLRRKLEYYIRMSDGDLGIEIGREYLVYGIVFWDGMPFLYILIDEQDEYPKPMAIEFFKVSEAKMSNFWIFSYLDDGSGNYSSSLLPEVWAKNPLFYERLIEGDEIAECQFKRYRKLIESE